MVARRRASASRPGITFARLMHGWAIRLVGGDQADDRTGEGMFQGKKRLVAFGSAVSALGIIALALTLTFGYFGRAHAAAVDPDQITTLPSGSHSQSKNLPAQGHANGHTNGIPNIDSITNFSDKFHADGFDPNGNPNEQWLYNMVGTAPQHQGTTTFNAPIVPVTLNLLDTNGQTRVVGGHSLIADPASFVTPTLNSPIFQNAPYTSSSTPTQFTDAVQRAEFFGTAKDDWHTMLAPSVKTGRVMSLPRGTYQFALNPDGTCCRFVLVDVNAFVNALFPATADDTTTPVGAAEHAGDITTKDISTFLFPNTFLFGSFGCCILGFHTYDFEPGDASNGNVEKRYVVNYSSWTTRGLFSGGPDDAPQDVSVLSHELSETFNDPFVASDGVHNITPWWQSSFNCQDNLETGDVIEGLPHDNFLITLNGFTYHVQNEALLQWFEGQTPSDAIGGAYSYPDTTVLPTANPPGTKANCAP